MIERPNYDEVDRALEEFTFLGQRVPGYMHHGLTRWISQGIAPGGFLQAVLMNNLKAAVREADDTNVRLLHVYVAFLYNHAPIACWGSENNFDRWIRRPE